MRRTPRFETGRRPVRWRREATGNVRQPAAQRLRLIKPDGLDRSCKTHANAVVQLLAGKSAGVAFPGRWRATEALADDEAHQDNANDGAAKPEALALGPEVGCRNEPRCQRQSRRQKAHPGDGER